MNSARRALLAATIGALLPARGRAQPADCGGGALPPRFTLLFDARATRGPFTLDGDNELSFDHDGGRYWLRSKLRSLLFNAEQRSQGAIDGAVLRPAEYVENLPRRPARITRLDWRAGTVQLSGAEQPAPIPPLLQDRLSLLLQVAQRLRAAPQESAPIELPVAGARSVSVYRFERRGAEALALPAGRTDTLKLERPLAAEHDRIELWLAPSLCWLPVRLRFTDDKGQVIDNRLREARVG